MSPCGQVSAKFFVGDNEDVSFVWITLRANCLQRFDSVSDAILY